MKTDSNTITVIDKHGIIGNLQTCALVTVEGMIDFLCWPNLDSPSIFTSLLDPKKGGYFSLAPVGDAWRAIQHYLPDSNVLQTRWLSKGAMVELTDFIAINDDVDANPVIIRKIKMIYGSATIKLHCSPRFNYASEIPEVSVDKKVYCFKGEQNVAMTLASSQPLKVKKGQLDGEFTLMEGECAEFVFGDAKVKHAALKHVDQEYHKTLAFWQQWVSQSKYRGRWREAVTRSSLVLKLLTSQRYGSIAAAATFGLPELPGGERNWDYRATWLRDASFSCYALIRLGYVEEAKAFSAWIGRCMENSKFDPKRLQVMYRLDSETDLTEEILPHLAGYLNSKPVRKGNEAYKQLQLDIYGELLDAVYLTTKYGDNVSHRGWGHVVRLVDYVCEIWDSPDAGIWEMRGEPANFLYSRLMCWVALDRALRLGAKRSLSMPFAKWEATRQKIRDDIWNNFWNDELGHFTSTRHGTDLDGSMLLMPLFRFIGSKDPDWLATLAAIRKKLMRDGMVRRYLQAETPSDSLRGEEGYFVPCSFWYVECLARADFVDEARIEFERLLHYANHLGLYAEEFDERGFPLGNFPQALSHLALISAAFYLDKKMSGNQQTWQP
ncbi:glycoside hydrolase family 15 protein [Kosakonia sp. BYX6]|uniref:Glycoside hydrolase family 15 protein n=1 Tax=Kosakonia calanthes TaxID=3139408 RepID=A0ABZ3BA62_9ENTR